MITLADRIDDAIGPGIDALIDIRQPLPVRTAGLVIALWLGAADSAEVAVRQYVRYLTRPLINTKP